jgi:transposase
MSIEESVNERRRGQRKFSEEERRNYCIAWEASGLNKIEFCKAQGISRSALRQWYNSFKKEGSDNFLPLGVNNQSSFGREENIRVELCFSNQLRLAMTIHPKQ